MKAETGHSRITDFFKLEYHKLLHYVHRFIDDTAARDAEDIIQDVMVNLYSRSDITIPVENLSAYIYKSLKNRVIDTIRKKAGARQVNVDQTDLEQYSLSHWLQSRQEHPSQILEKKDLYEKLFAVIDTLGEKERAVLVATEVNQRTFQSLSIEWNIPIGTLLARKSRALAKIKQKFSTYEDRKTGG